MAISESIVIFPGCTRRLKRDKKMPNFYKILGIWGVIDPPVCLQFMKNPDGKI